MLMVAIGWLLAALLVALVVVRIAITYAHRRGMLDHPGQRRSHRVPTPRGGGIGVVVAAGVCMSGALLSLPEAWPTGPVFGLLVALALVAAVGWWDDHHSLPVLPRLLVQLLAVGFFSCALLIGGPSWWWLPLLLVGGVGSINLHNFMDGIDGLLAQQAVFVAAGLALLAWTMQQPALAVAIATLGTASIGFWCFNRPPARIFMGDVGSGSIGLLIFAFAAMLWRVKAASLWPALILCSGFMVDAGLTLLTRICRGRRWYTAHREHLYQWLVRCGSSHAMAGAGYLVWNVGIAAPLAWLASSHPRAALPITMGFYLVATAVWLTLKRRCLRRDLHRTRHVVT